MRDYFDVRDLANFIVKLTSYKSIPEGIFNIGSGIGLTEMDIINLVKYELEMNIDINYMSPRDFDIPYAVLDIKNAFNELDWYPSITINDTIRELSYWVKR